jgi:hypothetical protein
LKALARWIMPGTAGNDLLLIGNGPAMLDGGRARWSFDHLSAGIRDAIALNLNDRAIEPPALTVSLATVASPASTSAASISPIYACRGVDLDRPTLASWVGAACWRLDAQHVGAAINERFQVLERFPVIWKHSRHA